MDLSEEQLKVIQSFFETHPDYPSLLSSNEWTEETTSNIANYFVSFVTYGLEKGWDTGTQYDLKKLIGTKDNATKEEIHKFFVKAVTAVRAKETLSKSNLAESEKNSLLSLLIRGIVPPEAVIDASGSERHLRGLLAVSSLMKKGNFFPINSTSNESGGQTFIGGILEGPHQISPDLVRAAFASFPNDTEFLPVGEEDLKRYKQAAAAARQNNTQQVETQNAKVEVQQRTSADSRSGNNRIPWHEISNDNQLIALLNASASRRQCAVCGFANGKAVLQKCGNCNLTYYCSKEHQRIHWESWHKYCCKAICFNCRSDEMPLEGLFVTHAPMSCFSLLSGDNSTSVLIRLVGIYQRRVAEMDQADSKVDDDALLACYGLGISYYDGVCGLQRNTREAVKCWRKGAEHGHDGCKVLLARATLVGLGASKDMDKGMLLLCESKDIMGSGYVLAWFYLHGIYVRQNNYQALSLLKYLHQREPGNFRINTELSTMCLMGWGGPRDMLTSGHLFSLAVQSHGEKEKEKERSYLLWKLNFLIEEIGKKGKQSPSDDIYVILKTHVHCLHTGLSVHP